MCYYWWWWWRRSTNIHLLVCSILFERFVFISVVSLCFAIAPFASDLNEQICIEQYDLHMKWWWFQSRVIRGLITTPFLFHQFNKRVFHLLMQAVYLFGLSIWFVILSLINHYIKWSSWANLIIVHSYLNDISVATIVFYKPIEPNWRVSTSNNNYNSVFN